MLEICDCIYAILCCPCITCLAVVQCYFKDKIFLEEICNLVFEKDFISNDIIGKKWIIDGKKNWLFISK